VLSSSLQRVHTVSADVGSLGVKDALKEVVRQMGHVDVLVNCAGTTHTAPLHETPPETCQVNCLSSEHGQYSFIYVAFLPY